MRFNPFWADSIMFRSIIILLVTACAGAAVGLLVGQRGDVFFHIDTRIIGVVVGAVAGSVLPYVSNAGPFTRAACAALGVMATVLVFVGPLRVAPDVLIAMSLIAATISTLLGFVVRRIIR